MNSEKCMQPMFAKHEAKALVVLRVLLVLVLLLPTKRLMLRQK